jgi:hypothetical protein
MIFFKHYYNYLAVAGFIFVIIIAHLFSPDDYNWTKHTISHLGCQGYNGKCIMQFGFIAFGFIMAAGIFLNGISWKTAPVLIYALCVGLTGIFCAEPFFTYHEYSGTEAEIHSFFAQTAGMSFCLGILVQLLYARSQNQKWLHLFFFILIIGLSASFGIFVFYQGAIQRLLYLSSFIWLVRCYES